MRKEIIISVIIIILCFIVTQSTNGQSGKELRSSVVIIHSTTADYSIAQQESLIQGAKDEIIDVMKRHIQQMSEHFVKEPGFELTKRRLTKLFRNDVLSFSVDVAFEEVDNSLKNGQHFYRSMAFDDIYIAVSTLPTIDDQKCRKLIPGGYLTLLDTLLAKSEWLKKDCDFAHWIYCYAGEGQHKVHLTFIPSKELSDQKTVWIFAQDLMTDEEKRKIGIE